MNYFALPLIAHKSMKIEPYSLCLYQELRMFCVLQFCLCTVLY